MLTRLRIKGFKNLADEDIFFGAFTCIAGRNGVGKSNIFDAITFLSALADKSIVDAALAVRGTNGRLSDLGEIFTKGAGNGIRQIEIQADLITPLKVIDEYEREVEPLTTYLEYKLTLAYDPKRQGGKDGDPIYIVHESLDAKQKRLKEAKNDLHFLPAQGQDWFKEHIRIHANRRPAYISMIEQGTAITLHSEGTKYPGRPPNVFANKSPRTRLSGVTSEEHPTALAARREMQSWRLLQLEPSALRRMDEFRDKSVVSVTGEHLPNALLRIGNQAEIAANLSDLIPGIVSVDVESDEARELRSLKVTLKDRIPYAASSLSDGTLRFLALAIMSSDANNAGLLCMEEPENGIHPERIEAMLHLVKQLADTDYKASDNPEKSSIRQVIINTHSPLVVGAVDEDDLLMAQAFRISGHENIKLKPLMDSWRQKTGGLSDKQCVSKGVIGNYLGLMPSHLSVDTELSTKSFPKSRKIRDKYTEDMFKDVLSG
jgi:predicted ATPase